MKMQPGGQIALGFEFSRDGCPGDGSTGTFHLGTNHPRTLFTYNNEYHHLYDEEMQAELMFQNGHNVILSFSLNRFIGVPT